MTALHNCVDDPECIALLVGAGADLEAMTQFHQTPLMSHVSTMKYSSAKKLVELGADVMFEDPVRTDNSYFWVNMLCRTAK